MSVCPLNFTVEEPIARLVRRCSIERTREREHWAIDLLPCVRGMETWKLVEMTGYSRRHVKRLKTGSRIPSSKYLPVFERIVRGTHRRARPSCMKVST